MLAKPIPAPLKSELTKQIPGLPGMAIYGTPISCGIRQIQGLYLLNEGGIATLVEHSSDPLKYKMHGRVEVGTTFGSYQEYYLKKGMGYLMSSLTPNLEAIKALIEKHDLGTVTLTHQHPNHNYKPDGSSHTIGVLYWTWNGNTVKKQEVAK